MYEVSPQHYLVWLWTGVRRRANKSFSVCICLNKKCQLTKDRFLLSPSSYSFSFSSLALTSCFLFHPLPTVLFLSISSRLPPSSFLLYPTPPYFSLLKNSSWYGASFSSSCFNCLSFYQPSFLWLVLVISFLCSERFMLNYFSDQLLKLGSMLSKKTERKDKTKTSRKPFRIKCFFQG